jgi:formate dehydrogenase iron-sulfur subunit
MSIGILKDLTKCIGCEACVWACKEINDLPREDQAKELSATTWTKLDHYRGVSVRRQCMHCNDPACVSVCPVAALEKTSEGPVIYHAKKCMGCRYCMIGCPFNIPKYEWNTIDPLVKKCTFCAETRLVNGQQPACTANCPTGATIFGNRDDLIGEAQKRIRENPGRYVDHIYGLNEAGGTSVLYLSAIPFDLLGFKTKRFDPYPRLTWEILSKLPTTVTVGGVMLAGISWIIRRRQELSGSAHPPAGTEKKKEG